MCFLIVGFQPLCRRKFFFVEKERIDKYIFFFLEMFSDPYLKGINYKRGYTSPSTSPPPRRPTRKRSFANVSRPPSRSEWLEFFGSARTGVERDWVTRDAIKTALTRITVKY